MLKKISKLPLITSFSSVFLVIIILSLVFVLSIIFVKTVIQDVTNDIKHEYLVSKNFSVSSTWLKGVPSVRNYKILVEENYTPIIFASSLNDPTQIEIINDSKGDGRYVFVVESKFGNLVMLQDRDGDGSADIKKIYDTNLNDPWGIFYYEKDLYLAQKNSVIRYKNILENYVSKMLPDKEIVVNNLPSLVGEDYKSIFVKDNILFVTIPSSCILTNCTETDLRRSSMVSYNLTTQAEEIFAKNLYKVPDFTFDINAFYVIDLLKNQQNPEIKVVKKDLVNTYSILSLSSKPTSIEIENEYLFLSLAKEKRIVKYNINEPNSSFKDFVVFDSTPDSNLFNVVDVKKYQAGFLLADSNGVIFYLKSNGQ